MIFIDRVSLECDLAETYNIYDMTELPASRVALFSCGLRDNSRIKMSMSNTRYSLENIMLASILDKLSILVWMKTKDAQNKPKMILDILLGNTEETTEVLTFKDASDFEKARKQILMKGEK